MPSYDQVLIQNSGTVGGNGTADPTAVTDGEIEVFPSDNGASIDLSSGSYTGEDSILLALGGPGDEATTTSILDTSKLSISKLAYSAPAKQVTEVDIGTVSADQELTLKIQNLEEGFQPFPIGNFTVEALASDSESDIVDKFVTAINTRVGTEAINGESGATVTASNESGPVLQLTADEFGEIFTVSATASGGWDPSISTTTNPTEGNGTFNHVDEAFKDTYGSMSRYTQNTNLLGKLDLPESPAVSGNTYDIYVFRHENDNDRNINKSFEYQTIFVAIDSGLTTTNFDSWFGV